MHHQTGSPIRKCLNFIMFDRGTERGACNGKAVFSEGLNTELSMHMYVSLRNV